MTADNVIHKPAIIIVDIKRLQEWYVATSHSLPGLHVADPNLSLVIKEIPDVIQALYKAKYDVIVNVREGSSETDSVFPLCYMAEAA